MRRKSQQVREKPVKSFWYCVDLGDKEEVEQFREDVAEGLGGINKTGLPGKLVFAVWAIP